ncbi:unnamed protein product [Clavelina lepadiformis]|uniref:NACHT domain-containing protein n=1 Tax=Clavelina lepadiformis TaxID=159417 RepID=A0ABP0GBD1_CLALP
MSQNPNVNFQGSTINNARVVGSQGVNYTEQNESGIRLDNEGTMNMRDVIRGNSENVFAETQRTINQASGSYYQEGQVTDGVSVTNNVREQRNITQGKRSYYQQGPVDKVVIKNTTYQHPLSSSGQEQSMSLEQLNKLTTKLQGALKASAGKKSAKLPCPIRDKQVSYVSLEIVLKSGRSSKLEIETRFNDRKQMLKTLKAPKGSVNLKELLQCVQKRTEVNSCNCVNENCGYSVGIIGPAGIGKTTCTLELTKLICTGEIPGYYYVFLIRFRNVDYNKEKATSLLEFLLTSSGSHFSYSTNQEKALMKILQDSSNVMLILDGVDEARFQQTKTSYVMRQLFDRAIAEDFIKNILAGNLLPHAVKFVTSRPEQMFELHSDCRPILLQVFWG